MAEWMKRVIREEGELLPKSAIGKAFNYTIQRWKLLSAYLYDGSLEIDRAAFRNNLVENAIRPVALGRKNYWKASPAVRRLSQSSPTISDGAAGDPVYLFCHL